MLGEGSVAVFVDDVSPIQSNSVMQFLPGRSRPRIVHLFCQDVAMCVFYLTACVAILCCSAGGR